MDGKLNRNGGLPCVGCQKSYLRAQGKAHVRLLLAFAIAIGFPAGAFLTAAETTPITQPQGSPGRKYGKAKYHRSFMSRIQKGPIGILFLGDSITEGLNEAGKETMLAQFERYQPAVFGVGGEETKHLLYRLTTGETAIDPNPKVVVLMIGVNDISHNSKVAPATVAAGIKKNLDVIRENLPESKVMLMSLLPFGKLVTAAPRQKVIAVNELIQKFADSKSVFYVDAYSEFLDKEGTVMDGLMDGASLHPLDKGYQVWYKALWTVVEPFLEE